MRIHRLAGSALAILGLTACQPAASEPESTPAATAAPTLAASPSTAPDPAHCFIEVDGTVWLDAPCLIDDSDPDAISINTGPQPAQVFAYVITFEGKADASWNEGHGASHAQAPLGEMTRDGLCWSNARARICRPETSGTAQVLGDAGG